MSIGLIPILWSDGTGSAIMKRIAAPMVGGIVTSFILELLVYPAIYAVWKERTLRLEPEEEPMQSGAMHLAKSEVSLSAQ
jgi:Cu(I)/Ag(I) efflux system membrane protein CusA/SilA